MDVLLKLLLAPALIVLVTVVQRRYGHAVGGRLAALPLTSGPFVILLAATDGLDDARAAAVGILTGAPGAVVFCAFYAHLAAARLPRRTCLATAALACTATIGVLARISPPPWASIALLLLTILSAVMTWPEAGVVRRWELPQWELPARAAIAAGIVFVLASASSVLGAEAAGVLTGFPVPAAVLIALTHRAGSGATIVLSRGLVIGMLCSSSFFLVVVTGLGQLPTLACFGLAVLAALGTQLVLQLRALSAGSGIRFRRA